MKSFWTSQQIVLTICLVFLVNKKANCDISVSNHEIKLRVNEKATFSLIFNNITKENADLNLIVQHSDLAKVTPQVISLNNIGSNVTVTVEALGAGHTEVTANLTNNSTINIDEVYLRVTINKIDELDTASSVDGWIYFAAWSISFYPQIYINWKRHSVVGLNFDFILLNIIGFTLYAIFNLGLYLIPEIKEEYSNRYPRGLNPVQINDVVFAVHATAATIFTIIQCFMYERAEQKVSVTARSIIGLFGIAVLISIILSWCNVIHWLDFLYICSYIKLTITLIKYIPQAYMNYKRKSTIGWSIGNIFLDFTGGTLSMLQMILLAYNYDDWVSIFGDPTKFGLGLFSVAFDIFFIIQHYVFYKHTNYEDKQETI